MSRTIVIIDDSLTVRKVAERQLKGAGFAVVGAATGSEGLDAVRRHRPDLLLLDFMLPDMKGTDVCAGLRQSEHTADIPIIVLSGRDSGQLQESFADVDAVKACIEKPFGSDLVDHVRGILASAKRSSARTELPASDGTRDSLFHGEATPPRRAVSTVSFETQGTTTFGFSRHPSTPAECAGTSSCPDAARPAPSQSVFRRPEQAEGRAKEDRVGKIVEEILQVLDRSSESRRVMLRIIVRRYLSHDS